MTEIAEGLSREYGKKLNVHGRVAVSLSIGDLPTTASTDLREAFAFVLREALQNVYEHARATEVLVSASFNDHRLTLVVADDGAGFDYPPGEDHDGHLGLPGIEEHVAGLGGSVVIETERRQGTRLVAVFPLA